MDASSYRGSAHLGVPLISRFLKSDGYCESLTPSSAMNCRPANSSRRPTKPRCSSNGGDYNAVRPHSSLGYRPPARRRSCHQHPARPMGCRRILYTPAPRWRLAQLSVQATEAATRQARILSGTSQDLFPQLARRVHPADADVLRRAKRCGSRCPRPCCEAEIYAAIEKYLAKLDRADEVVSKTGMSVPEVRLARAVKKLAHCRREPAP